MEPVRESSQEGLGLVGVVDDSAPRSCDVNGDNATIRPERPLWLVAGLPREMVRRLLLAMLTHGNPGEFFVRDATEVARHGDGEVNGAALPPWELVAHAAPSPCYAPRIHAPVRSTYTCARALHVCMRPCSPSQGHRVVATAVGHHE
jgi:hypothetical protein